LSNITTDHAYHNIGSGNQILSFTTELSRPVILTELSATQHTCNIGDLLVSQSIILLLISV